MVLLDWLRHYRIGLWLMSLMWSLVLTVMLLYRLITFRPEVFWQARQIILMSEIVLRRNLAWCRGRSYQCIIQKVTKQQPISDDQLRTILTPNSYSLKASTKTSTFTIITELKSAANKTQRYLLQKDMEMYGSFMRLEQIMLLAYLVKTLAHSSKLYLRIVVSPDWLY